MSNFNKEEMLKTLDENISKLKDKTFNVFFYILDTKGNPTPSLEYIYQTALSLKKKGYNVTMLHQEKDFIGVEDWLGKEYAELKHANIEKDNVNVSPCDFLVIPEIFANVMSQTKDLRCKKVVLVQDYKNITEFMPVSKTMTDFGIIDIIATTKKNAEMTAKYFPGVRSSIVSPSIMPVFRNNDNPRKLVINIISKDVQEIHRIMKPFYWENQLYKWVSFRDIRGLSKEAEAEALRDAFATIWLSDKNDFGAGLLEALSCGTIVLAKVPEAPADWMLDEEGKLTESIIWFDDADSLPDMIAPLVRSWTLDKVPADVYTDQSKFYKMFTQEKMDNEIDEAYVKNLFERRLKEFEEVKKDVENNVFKGEIE